MSSTALYHQEYHVNHEQRNSVRGFRGDRLKYPIAGTLGINTASSDKLEPPDDKILWRFIKKFQVKY